jgi:hypothetical protein
MTVTPSLAVVVAVVELFHRSFAVGSSWSHVHSRARYFVVAQYLENYQQK